MLSTPIENYSREEMYNRLTALESYLDADVIAYYGQMITGITDSDFKFVIETLHDSKEERKRNKLYVILTTTGGSIVPVERIVNIMRNFYEEVNFIVPDYAYSAGTILCMSGNNIFMNYNSVLGPIDPQVQNKEGHMVAALGYLDKFEEMIEKSRQKKLTEAEFLLLKGLDLGDIREYEQARDLAIDLTKNWLVKYKFANWTTHSSSGKAVTDKERMDRAEEIATCLSNNNRWKTHGRPINMRTLVDELRLKITDYETVDSGKFGELVKNYYEFKMEYIINHKYGRFIHTRRFL